ncbi:putative Ig domain-containing protein [Pectobacterium colocasium]|uniref:putative Ig domain-containing protein n=1 Tax=Pectobacterium colocasium TaxID=2878098 RepID=UPI001CD7A3D1|nr:putative Ig domain-containing protein [Pectobacterium colocasium]
MLWRHWLGKKSRQVSQGVEFNAESPLGVMLEARMLFDGAVAATVEQTATTQDTATQTATADTASHTVSSQSDQHETNTQDSTTSADSSVAMAGSTTHKEVVFIDTSVADYQQLAHGVKDGVEVVLLDASKDGLSQIAQWAQTHTGYEAIHIISNGGEGRLTLGNVTLTDSMLASRSADLTTIGQALSDAGDILLYGCNVAEGINGKAFISDLAALTGADVAASTDLTGSAALNGDWVLEAQVGNITTDLALTAATQSGYTRVLDTFTFEAGSSGGSGNNQTWQEGTHTLHFDFVGNVLAGLNSDGNTMIYDVQTDGSSSSNSLTFTISIPGYIFDLSSLDMLNADGVGNMNYTVSSSKSTSGDNKSGVLTFPGAVSYTTVSGFNSNFVGVSSITITTSGTNEYYLDNLVLNNIRAASSVDATSTVTAGPSSEATTFSTTATSAASAASLLDFTITDPGTSDGSATTVSAFYANVSGTATSSELSQMRFLLSGPDATNVVGTYDSSTGRITFSGLSLSIANSSSETYTIKAYYNDNTSSNDITDHHTVVLSVNANNFTTGSGSSTFAGSQVNVTNGSGASIDVAATKLIYSQSPSTAVVSGINFTTQPIVIAVDDRGNIDTDFSGTVTLSENGSGSLTGTTSVTASNGIATFNGVKYTSASDADANFVLTAASGSLVNAVSTSIDPDVVATRLVFSTQPVPVTIQDGQSTSFSTVPVVRAVDANGMVDQDYTTNITLSVTDPNDGTVDGTVNSLSVTSGDQDVNGSTVTLTPSGGIATYTGLIIQYTNSGSTNTLALRAISGSLTAVNSSSITSTSNTAPVFNNLNGGATYTENGSAVVIDNDVTVADTELDALNSGLGNYNGSSITIARNGGANSNDIFGNSGLLGVLTQGQNFTYNGTAMGSVTTNSNGILTLTFNSNATSVIVDAVLQSLTYANSSDNPPASVTLNWTFNDGSLNSAGSNQAVLTITPVNDAPTLSGGVTVTLTTTTEDVTSSSTSISSLLSAAGYADVDNGAVSGIALTALTGNGTWQYSTNSGANWFSVGTVSSSSALLLSSTTQIRYVPDGANGETATLGFRAWDQTSGTATSGATRGLADTSTTGGSSAFSANSAQATLAVSNVNDAPTLSSGTTVTLTPTTEDVTSAATTISSLLGNAGYGDVDNGASSGIAITTTVGNGGWQYSTDSGANWFNVGTVSGSSALLLSSTAQIRYVPDSANGETATFSFRAWDQTSGTATNGATKGLADTSTVGGSSAFSINSAQASLAVSNVNDAPTLSSGTTVTLTTTTEDVTSSSTSISSLLSAAGYADVDNGAVSGIALTALTGNGTWQYSTNSGANWFSVGTVSSSSALLLSSTTQIRYVPDSANGETATLGFKAWDQTSGTATAGASKGLADTSTSGGGSAFSTNSAQASLVVTDVNDAPTVGNTVSGQSATKDAVFSFTVPSGTFVDVDSGDTLILSATLANGSALPAWLTFNPATRTFSGTPGSNDVGNLTIRVTATDSGNASVSTTFGLTINNNNLPPVVSTPVTDQSIAQDGSFSFIVPAGTFTDPDIGDTLTLSATLANGSALPAWLTFNAATSTFSGTPGNADVGNLSIRVTATDGSNASVSTTFGLTVTNVNDAPVVSGTVPQQTIAQGGSLNLTLPPGLFTDPDAGDTLTLSATLTDGSALPAWLTFNPATGTFSGTPGNADVGNLSIRVTATDGSNASVSTTFGLTVTNVNDAPVVSTPIPPQTIAQDGSFSFIVPAGTFTDPDIGDTLTLSATLADGSALPAWLTFNAATGTFSGTPGNADVGNLSIRVTATDGSNDSVSTTFGLTVTNVNDAPVVSGTVPSQTIAQGGSLNLTLPPGLFTDPDAGDSLTLSATLADGSSLPAWLTFNAATGTFSGTPGNADVGNLSIRVTATDGSNASVSTTFGLTVTNVNDAPVVSGTVPPQTIAQGGSLNLTLPPGLFTDPDAGDSLTLSATLADGSSLPAWLTFNAATGTFSGTPGNADVGNLSIRVTATDGSNASVSTTFGLTVTNVNDAPVVSGTVPPQTIAQGGGLNLTLPPGLFTDPDIGDTLTLSATLADGSALPAWLTFNAATGTFSGTPGNADVGNLSIRVTATDGSNASVSTTFGLTVTNVNDAPVVSGTIPPQTIAQGGSLNLTLPPGLFTDPDAGDTLTLSATLADGSALPAWLTFNPATGTFSGTPGNADVGNLSIRVTATDSSSTSVNTTFTLSIISVPAEVDGGDPEFRLGNSTSLSTSRPQTNLIISTQGESQDSSVTLGAIFSSSSLGTVGSSQVANTATITSTIFHASQRQPQAGIMPVGQIAGTFAQGNYVGDTNHFDSSLGSFPSFNSGGALGGTSALSGLFSGINLPSITPMEVFSSGSWKGVNVGDAQSTRLTSPPGVTAGQFIPDLERQLQHIGDAKLQRLAAIEQALIDMDKHSFGAERS